MGCHRGLAALVGVALLLATGQCDVNCKGNDGHPGNPGIHGRDGRPGQKGEKGEPATNGGPVDPAILLRLKGETGGWGKQGVMGPKGYRGEVGPAGLPGVRGPPGPVGRRIADGGHSPELARSAFSVMRTLNSYPQYRRAVTYQKTVFNTNRDMNTGTGEFVCRVAGVYYFNFHSLAKVSMCLAIVSDSNPTPTRIGFCDYVRSTEQVLSGGVVLQLRVGQKVWLESFKDSQRDGDVNDTNDKQIIFNGFLLFNDE